jgi:hypothetical protein
MVRPSVRILFTLAFINPGIGATVILEGKAARRQVNPFTRRLTWAVSLLTDSGRAGRLRVMLVFHGYTPPRANKDCWKTGEPA